MEPRAKVEPGSGKHNVYTHFPKNPNCDTCLKTKITRASCRRRAGTVVPRAEHFGDLITADHKVLSEESDSRNNHRYVGVVQDLATQWIQLYPCKTNIPRKPKEACESSWSQIGTQKSLTLTIPWNWQVLRGIILESLYVNTTQIRNKWHCRKSSVQSERRDICGAIAVRSRWRMVGGFYGMLLLSAKHSRSLVWWEDTMCKAVRNALQRTSNTVRSNGRISPYFCERPI